MKFDQLEVLVKGVACRVLDGSGVDEELNRLMEFEFGFVPVGRHVCEGARWHCLGFLHILEGVNAESRVHLVEVDAEARTETVVWIQTMGIGFVNGTIVVPATVGQCQLVPVTVRLHQGELVGAVSYLLLVLVGRMRTIHQ